MPASRPSRPPAAGLARPRGPLPARVYWTRRLAVLGTALLLVVGLARLLGTGSDGGEGGDVERATTASASIERGRAAGAATPSSPSATLRPGVRPGTPRPRRAEPAAPTRTPLAQPEGRCLDEDVRVVPEVPAAVGGDTITVRLVLRTVEADACWWYASPGSLTMRIRSGKDEIWTSRECPRALPRRSVVLRRAVDRVLTVDWSGRRSDEECSRLTAWALPGFYHVEAAALAGEPADVQFEVTAPEPAVVTRTVGPRRDRGQEAPRGRQQP